MTAHDGVCYMYMQILCSFKKIMRYVAMEIFMYDTWRKGISTTVNSPERVSIFIITCRIHLNGKGSMIMRVIGVGFLLAVLL